MTLADPGSRQTEVAFSDAVRICLGNDLKDYWVVIVYAVGIGILSIAVPVAVQYFVTTIGFVGLLQPIVVVSLALVLFLAFGSLLRILQFFTIEVLSRRAFVRLTAIMAQRFPYLLPSEDESRASLANRFIEILAIQKNINTLLIETLGLALQMGVGFLLLAFYHPIFLAFDLVLIFFLYWVVKLSRSGAMRAALIESKKKYILFDWVQELAKSAPLFRSRSSRGFGMFRADELLGQYMESRKVYFRSLMGQNIGLAVVYSLGSALFLAMGGYLVLKSQLTLGQLVAAELVITSILVGVWKFGIKIETIDEIFVALYKLADLFGRDATPRSGVVTEDQGPLALQFHNVEQEFLVDRVGSLNLKFPAGSRTLISGGSGSGKTQVVRLFAGEVRPRKGYVALGMLDIREIHPEHYRSLVHVARGVEFVSGSVLDNLRLFRPDATLEEVGRVCQRIGILDRVNSFSRNLETPLHLVLSQMSASERVQMVLVRACLAEPSVMVIDGLMDEVDRRVCHHIMGYLTQPDHPWTLVVTSQDQELGDLFDQSINLDELASNRVKGGTFGGGGQ